MSDELTLTTEDLDKLIEKAKNLSRMEPSTAVKILEEPLTQKSNKRGGKRAPRRQNDRKSMVSVYTLCGRELFGSVPSHRIVDLFEALLVHISDYQRRNPQPWASKEGYGLPQLISHGLINYLDYYERVVYANWRENNTRGIFRDVFGTENATGTTAATGLSSMQGVAQAVEEIDGAMLCEDDDDDEETKEEGGEKVTSDVTGDGGEKGTENAEKQQPEKEEQKEEQVSANASSTASAEIIVDNKLLTAETETQQPRVESSPSAVASAIAPPAGTSSSGNNNGIQVSLFHRKKLSAADRMRILRQLMRIWFPPDRSPWGFIVHVFEAKQDNLLVPFHSAVMDAAAQGQASFTVLNYCLSEGSLAGRFASPLVIIQALLLGPLRAFTIESFASTTEHGRSESFRAQLKSLLLTAEKWTQDHNEYIVGATRALGMDPRPIWSFELFRKNTISVLEELRSGVPTSDTIDDSWAHAAIRLAIKHTLQEKQWDEEQMLDVFHSVLAQRPEMKIPAVRLLRDANFTDQEKIRRLKSVVPGNRVRMPKSTFDGSLHEKREGFLALPSDVTVYFIDTAHKLSVFENQIVAAEKAAAAATPQKRVVLAIDAEWNPYVSFSKASILQIAFARQVFLLDIDSLANLPRFVPLIDRIFLSPNILKLGFQFSEDLVQLRLAVKNSSIGFYEPRKLICVGRLVAQLINEIQKRTYNLADFLHLDTAGTNDDNKNGDKIAAEKGDESAGAEKQQQQQQKNNGNSRGKLKKTPQFQNLKAATESIITGGLSKLCERVLGEALDKSEQCSVWDRRPLRTKQIRYAALDAHCLLQLFERCENWARTIGADMGRLLEAQADPCCSLPLFSELTSTRSSALSVTAKPSTIGSSSWGC